MSLDMTMAARGVDADEAELEAHSPPVPRPWQHMLLAGAAALIGVVVSSALGLVLFLR